VLRGCPDSGGSHPGDECGHAACDGRRIVPVLAVQLADRGVLRIGARRHDVCNRRQVEVDARGGQLATPSGGHDLELRG